jgi:hypothetical protein
MTLLASARATQLTCYTQQNGDKESKKEKTPRRIHQLSGRVGEFFKTDPQTEVASPNNIEDHPRGSREKIYYPGSVKFF